MSIDSSDVAVALEFNLKPPHNFASGAHSLSNPSYCRYEAGTRKRNMRQAICRVAWLVAADVQTHSWSSTR